MDSVNDTLIGHNITSIHSLFDKLVGYIVFIFAKHVAAGSHGTVFIPSTKQELLTLEPKCLFPELI